jgi:glycerate dehydrogenase
MPYRLVLLDAKTLGNVSNMHLLEQFGKLQKFDKTHPEQTISRVKNTDIIITNKVIIDKTVMDHAPNLKLICIAATGTNNVDLDYAQKRGIAVMNAAGYSTSSVAQHTFAILFQLLNHIHWYDKYVKSKAYSNNDLFTHHGPVIFELKNKRFGIIGLGAIGRAVAKIASSFGAGVSYYSTSGHNKNDQYISMSLDDLLTTCDIISIHAPLNKNTKSLIGYNELTKMKRHAILINMGRGGIVVEQDLTKALNENLIEGACLDVYEQEPPDTGNPLLQVKDQHRLILTPHVAWASIEARERLIAIIAENISSFVGKK